MEPVIDHGNQRVIARADLDQLRAAIARRGFRLIGPTVRDGVIVYDGIASARARDRPHDSALPAT